MSLQDQRARWLDQLASALRSEASLRAAIATMATQRDRPEFIAEADRLFRSGCSARVALRPLAAALDDDGPPIVTVIEMGSRAGCDLPNLLSELARSIEDRARQVAQARSATAGIVLSGRLIAALPLLMLVGLPGARRAFEDLAGFTTVSVGAALAAVGFLWMGRLVPPLPTEDDAALLADLLAAGMNAGVNPVTIVYDLAAVGGPLTAIRRWLSLGLPLHEALERTGHPGLVEIGDVLGRARRDGSAAPSELRRLSASRRGQARATFERAARRAPVWMIVPLVVCVLPAFVLVGIVPFVRGISLGA